SVVLLPYSANSQAYRGEPLTSKLFVSNSSFQPSAFRRHSPTLSKRCIPQWDLAKTRFPDKPQKMHPACPPWWHEQSEHVSFQCSTYGSRLSAPSPLLL